MRGNISSVVYESTLCQLAKIFFDLSSLHVKCGQTFMGFKLIPRSKNYPVLIDVTSNLTFPETRPPNINIPDIFNHPPVFRDSISW